jgi:HSP20 family protein
MFKRIRPVVLVRRGPDPIRRLLREPPSGRTDFPELDGTWIPRLDLVETKTALIVAMEAPGLEAEDLILSLQPNRLVIKGRKREPAAPAGLRYLRLEREYGPFRRMLVLPRIVLPGRARATLDNGVLTVVLPKPAETRTKGRVVRIKKTME